MGWPSETAYPWNIRAKVRRLPQKNKFQIAVVLDEHGGTAGLITLEDIMEEIVGGLQDEFEAMESEKEVEVVDEKHVNVNGKMYEIDFESVSGQPVYSLLVNSKSHEAYVARSDENWQVLLRGRLYPITVEDEREKRLRAAAGGGVAESGEFILKAPMPGLVVAVPVNEGQEVKKGQVILILESMKMQNELKAPRDGTVQRIKVKAGESVEQKQTLLSVM